MKTLEQARVLGREFFKTLRMKEVLAICCDEQTRTELVEDAVVTGWADGYRVACMEIAGRMKDKREGIASETQSTIYECSCGMITDNREQMLDHVQTRPEHMYLGSERGSPHFCLAVPTAKQK